MDLSHFKREGFQVVRGIVPPDVIARVRSFLEKERGRSLDQIRSEVSFDSLQQLQQQAEEIHRDDLRFHQVSEATRRLLSGHFSLTTRLSRVLWEVPRSAPVQELLTSLFPGQKVRMHMPPTARFVLPGNRFAGVPPHQDVSYNKHVGDFVVLWVPLTQIDSVCGGVNLYGGGSERVERPRAPEGRFWLGGLSTGGVQPLHYHMTPGDGLLLNRWVVHGSAPNLSDGTRYSIDYRFFSASQTSKKHYLDLETWEVVEPRRAAVEAPREVSRVEQVPQTS